MIRILALLAVLPAFVVVSPGVPAAAAEACSIWTAEMQEDEGGPVLTASACAVDRPDAYLSLTCFDGRVWLRYDLSLGAEAAVDPDEVADVVFTFGEVRETLSMRYEDMDGRHAADVTVGNPLVGLLKSGSMLSIGDAAGSYPSHEFSLKGSSAAIDRLVADCG